MGILQDAERIHRERGRLKGSLPRPHFTPTEVSLAEAMDEQIGALRRRMAVTEATLLGVKPKIEAAYTGDHPE